MRTDSLIHGPRQAEHTPFHHGEIPGLVQDGVGIKGIGAVDQFELEPVRIGAFHYGDLPLEGILEDPLPFF